MSRELKSLAGVRSHPSYAFRRRVVRHLLHLDQREKEPSDVTAIAVLLRETAERMWSRLEKTGNSR